MKKQLVLRMTESQHKGLKSELHTSTGCESVRGGLCRVAQHGRG